MRRIDYNASIGSDAFNHAFQVSKITFDDDDLIAEVAGWSMTVTLFVLRMIRAGIGLDDRARVGMALLFVAALMPLTAAAAAEVVAAVVVAAAAA